MPDVQAPPLSITPRAYQTEAVQAVLSAYERGMRRSLIALPTGTGKTIVFALLLQQRGGRALVLAHRDELIQQAVDKLKLVDSDLDIGVVKAERDEHHAQVVVASVQTLYRKARLSRLRPDFDTIVVDEAHHAPAKSYQRILRYLHARRDDGPLVLGVTATPERADRKSLKAVFDRIVYQKPLLEMIEAGYLADLRAIQVHLQINLDQLHIRQGDFVESELESTLLEANAPEHILRTYKVQAPERKTLIFTPTVALAHTMAETFNRAGIAAEALDSTTPLPERRDILHRLRTGKTRVIANCAVLTEGFDEPSVDCIIIARPTRSRPLYQQMLGRGTRTYPGKTDCLILDVVGVSSRHTLQTAAELFDFKPKKLATQTVTELLDEQRQAESERQEALESTLHLTPVQLFERRALRWVETRQGAWVMSIGEHGTLRLTPDGEDTWQVHQLRRDFPPAKVAQHLPLSYAQGLAEDTARRLGVERLAAAEAPWRRDPASEKQLVLLKKFNLDPKPGLTKGEAADQISAIMGDWT
jgi:superfamily II DNA or RNA helicase